MRGSVPVWFAMDHDVWLRFERLDRRLAAIEMKIDAVLVTQTIE
jgi:hypothetical protein